MAASSCKHSGEQRWPVVRPEASLTGLYDIPTVFVSSCCFHWVCVWFVLLCVTFQDEAAARERLRDKKKKNRERRALMLRIVQTVNTVHTTKKSSKLRRRKLLVSVWRRGSGGKLCSCTRSDDPEKWRERQVKIVFRFELSFYCNSIDK